MLTQSAKDRLCEVARARLSHDLPDTLSELLDTGLLRNLARDVTDMLEEVRGSEVRIEIASSVQPVTLGSALRVLGKRAIGILDGIERKKAGRRELGSSYIVMRDDMLSVLASVEALPCQPDPIVEAAPVVEPVEKTTLSETASRVQQESAAKGFKPTKTLKSLSDLRHVEIKKPGPKPEPKKPEPKAPAAAAPKLELPPVFAPKPKSTGPGLDHLSSKNERSLGSIESMLHRYEHERGRIPTAIGKNDPGFIIFRSSIMLTLETPINSTRARQASVPFEFISGSPEPDKVSHQSHFIYVLKEQFVFGVPATDDARVREEKLRTALSGLKQTTKRNYASLMSESPRPFFRTPGNPLSFALLLDSHTLMALGNPNPLEIGFPLARVPLHQTAPTTHTHTHDTEEEDWVETPEENRKTIKRPETRVSTPRDAVEQEIQRRAEDTKSGKATSLTDIRLKVEKDYQTRFATDIKKLDALRANFTKLDQEIDTKDPGRVTYRLLMAGLTGHAFDVGLEKVRAITDPYKRDQALAKLLKSSVDVAKRFLEQTSHLKQYKRTALEKKIGELIDKRKSTKAAITALEDHLKQSHEKMLADARTKMRQRR